MSIRLFTVIGFLFSPLIWAGNVSLGLTEKNKIFLTSQVTFVMDKEAQATKKLQHQDSALFCILIDLPPVEAGKKIEGNKSNIDCEAENDRNCPDGEQCRSTEVKPGKHRAVLQYSYRLNGTLFSYGKEFSDTVAFEVKDSSSISDKSEPYATSGISIDTYAAYVSTVESLTIRNKPSQKGKAIGSLKKGETVYIKDVGKEVVTIDGRRAPWVLIKTDDGVSGFVFFGYLKTLE